MAGYHKISRRIWENERFRELWREKWDHPCRSAKSYPGPNEYPLSKRASICLQRRHRWKKVKPHVWPMVLKRFSKRCQGCGTKHNLFPDHVIPLVWGGTNDTENIQPLCASCNSGKGGTLPIPPKGCE